MEETKSKTSPTDSRPDYIDELLDLVLRLPTSDRVRIGTEIMQSFGPVDSDIEQAQIEEADRRARQMESGQVKGVPGEEVRKETEKIFTG